MSKPRPPGRDLTTRRNKVETEPNVMSASESHISLREALTKRIETVHKKMQHNRDETVQFEDFGDVTLVNDLITLWEQELAAWKAELIEEEYQRQIAEGEFCCDDCWTYDESDIKTRLHDYSFDDFLDTFETPDVEWAIREIVDDDEGLCKRVM